MAKYPSWQDEYWLMLMQLYLKRPQGMKPLYSRGLVDLALELHFPPEYLYRKMFKLRQIDTPNLQRLWDTYADNPRRLTREVKLLKRMNGFGNASEFYAGVAVNESWEKDFKPLEGVEPEGLTPVMLIMILDLYFRLTPNTMVVETPEVVSLAKSIRTKPEEVVGIMQAYQVCDPYLNNQHPVAPPCSTHASRCGSASETKIPKNSRIGGTTQRLLEIRNVTETHSNTNAESDPTTTTLTATNAASEVVGDAIGRAGANIDVELDDNPALEATHDDFDDIQTDNASHDNEPHDAADNDVQDSTNDDSMETAMADDNYERKSEREEREEALDNALANLGSDDEMPQASPYAQSDNNDNADYEETVWGDTTSFYDNLKEQMGMLELTDQQQEVMEYLIGSLDDDGILRKPLDDITDELAIYYGIDVAEAEVENLCTSYRRSSRRESAPVRCRSACYCRCNAGRQASSRTS